MCEDLGRGDEVVVTGGEFFQICIGGKGALKWKSLEERRAWPKEPGIGRALEETVILDTDGGHYVRLFQLSCSSGVKKRKGLHY